MLSAASAAGAAAAAARQARLGGDEAWPRQQPLSPLLRAEADAEADGPTARRAVACRAAWVAATLLFVALFMAACAVPGCRSSAVFWPTLAASTVLWVVRAAMDVPSCEEGGCDEDSPSTHHWAHWAGSLSCLSAGAVLSLLAIEPYLTTMVFVRGHKGEGSLQSLGEMLAQSPRPVQFFFTDGFVDHHLSVTESLCAGRQARTGDVVVDWPAPADQTRPRPQAPLERRPVAAPPCGLRDALSIAPVFDSELESVTNGTVRAWARGTQRGKLPATRCTEGGGLCAILPEAIVGSDRSIGGVGGSMTVLKRRAVDEFRAAFARFSVADDLPVLIFVDPQTVSSFPPELAAALAFYLLSVLLTCCPSALEAAVARAGLEDDDRPSSHAEDFLELSASPFARRAAPGRGPREVRLAVGPARAPRGEPRPGREPPRSGDGRGGGAAAARGGGSPRGRPPRDGEGDPPRLRPLLLPEGPEGARWLPPGGAAEGADRPDPTEGRDDPRRLRLLLSEGPEDELAEGEEPCVICCLRRKDTLLAPCGHVATCLACSEELHRRDQPCPICRTAFDGAYRVFRA